MKKLLLIIIFLLLSTSAPVLGEWGSTGLSSSFSYTPSYQFETDIDGGGSFSVMRHALRLNFSTALNQQTRVGLGLSYDLENWDFKNVANIQAASPWQHLHRPTLDFSVFHNLNQDWQLFFAPSLGLAQESGAKLSDSLIYGAVFSLNRNVTPELRLGVGFGVFEQLENTSLFPFLFVDWRINEQLRLTNPFSAGPVGPAGLELVWQPQSQWEFGFGGAYRSYRFRLAKDNAVPNGIGEVDFMAGFIRSTYEVSKQYSVDLSAGGLFAGSLGVEDSGGNSVGESDFDPAPFAALTFKGRF